LGFTPGDNVFMIDKYIILTKTETKQQPNNNQTPTTNNQRQDAWISP